MPEKPEVITVAKALKKKILGKEITDCKIYWDNIIVKPSPIEFIKKIIGQKISDVRTRGKWIVIELTDFILLVHLRMEGKFFFRYQEDERNKHEHVVFTLDNDIEMRYHDVRKFGKMYLLDKNIINDVLPLSELGYEYNDKRLNATYLLDCFHNKTLPIKTVLLDQSIIAGIGNIYDDEILFLSKISPLVKAKDLTKEDCENIINSTKIILDKAIKLGGTTIRSYTSEEGVHGLFQNELLVHGKRDELCPICNSPIIKIKINGRGTYYCPTCQIEK